MLGEQSSSVLNVSSQPFQDSGTPQRPGGGIETPFIINDKVNFFFLVPGEHFYHVIIMNYITNK